MKWVVLDLVFDSFTFREVDLTISEPWGVST